MTNLRMMSLLAPLAAGLALPAVCAAQSLPEVTTSAGEYVLTVPYLEYGTEAYAAVMRSRDLSTFVVDTSSVSRLTPLASPVDAATLAARTGGYRLDVPRVTYRSGTTTQYYTAVLNSSDLNRFTVEPSSVREVLPPGALNPPTGVTVSNVDTRTVGSIRMSSSGRLSVAWTRPAGATIDHYEITATESVYGTTSSTSATASETSKTVSALKAATTYAITVKVCGNITCTQSGSAAPVSGTTTEEFWQLLGSGNSVSGLTRIVSDGNARISATRFGADASGPNASRLQLYYGPSGTSTQNLAVAVTSQATDINVPGSYVNFTSMTGSTGLISPPTATTLISQVATGQGVPLSAAMGGRVRLFFEAMGSDSKTRIMYLDSQDGYTGRDFNAGSAAVCSTAADYQSGGGCAPTVAVGVEGDVTNGNSRIRNARQFKVGFPILDDWRWRGEAGTFMVFTTDSITGCSSAAMNHGYATWIGSQWQVQYNSTGCPKLFTNVQAALPMHVGDTRYKMYYGDPSITTGRGSGNLPFLGPKKLMYADGRSTGSTSVDFEDWESTSAARNVIFLWPNNDQLNDTAEGYIDDFHFLAPTGSLDLQMMYLAITEGTQPPIGAAAVLLNP